MPKHAKKRQRWRAAQEADGRFLNNYAMNWPQREDIAETLARPVAQSAYEAFERLAGTGVPWRDL